jgi:hypothetical protein
MKILSSCATLTLCLSILLTSCSAAVDTTVPKPETTIAAVFTNTTTRTSLTSNVTTTTPATEITVPSLPRYGLDDLSGISDRKIEMGYEFAKKFGGFYWNFILGAGWDKDFDDSYTIRNEFDEYSRAYGDNFDTYSGYMEKLHSLCTDFYLENSSERMTNFISYVVNRDDKIYIGETYAYAAGIIFIELSFCEEIDENTTRFYGEFLDSYWGGYPSFAGRSYTFWFDLVNDNGTWKLNQAGVDNSGEEINDIFAEMYLNDSVPKHW